MKLVGVLVLATVGTAAAAPAVGDTVVVKAGAKVYSSAYDSERGEVMRARAWKVTEVSGEWIDVERTDGGLVERITVKASALGGAVDAVTTTLDVVTGNDCSQRGRCNFAMRAGHRLQKEVSERSFVAAKTRIAFHHPVQVCALGPLLRFEIDDAERDWLAPAAAASSPALGYVYELAANFEILAGTLPAKPPACKVADKAANANRVVVGGAARGKPQMGLFALTENDSRVVGEKFDDLKVAYDYALSVAKKSWAGDRTFCEDAVRLSLNFIGGRLDDAEKKKWAKAAPLEIKRDAWNAILVRHALMVNDYEPALCEQTLQRYIEALRYAARNNLVLDNFGY